MGRRHEETFFQRRHPDGKQTHGNMLNITIIREIQIKATFIYHLTRSEWLKLTTEETTDVVWDVEKGKPSCTAGGNANWKTVWRFLKKLKIELPWDLVITLLGIYPKN